MFLISFFILFQVMLSIKKHYLYFKLCNQQIKNINFIKSLLKITNLLNTATMKMTMQELLGRNRQLKQVMQKCQQQIIQLKNIGHAHQIEIQNLSKFNEKLLYIIDDENLNKNLTRTVSGSNLQPIEEGNQRDNQIIMNNKHNKFQNQHKNYHPLADRLQHVDVQSVQQLNEEINGPSASSNRNKMSGQQHHNKTTAQQHRYRNNQCYSQQQGNSSISNQTPDPTTYREQKQSLISIPHLLHLQQRGLKTLSDYTQNLYHSIQQPFNHKSDQKQSIGYNTINKIQQAITERIMLTKEELRDQLAIVSNLIIEYKDQYDTQQYQQIAKVITDDLRKDRDEIWQVDKDANRIFINKQKQLQQLRAKLRDFNPNSKLKEISKGLNVSKKVALMLEKQILSKQAQHS